MKALFILSDNVYLTPYLNFYTSILKNANVNYDVVFWDKNLNENKTESNFYRFTYSSKTKLSKVFGYIKFRKFILNLLSSDEYDFVIPLHSVIYILIYRTLINKYSKRFIFDVRDYSFEKYSFFRNIQKKVVNNSAINIISSDGFKNFLPDAEYFVTHNFSLSDYDDFKQYSNPTDIVNISYIGLIRFMDQNKKIIDYFKNDKRFHLNFIGTNAEQLSEYCVANNVSNVSLIGTFDSDKTLDFYRKSDMVMNLYGNNNPLLDYALSNKLYFSAALYKPILVCENTYMETITVDNNLGFVVKFDGLDELDRLYSYITNLDREAYIKSCNEFITNVIEEQNSLTEKLYFIFSNLK